MIIALNNKSNLDKIAYKEYLNKLKNVKVFSSGRTTSREFDCTRQRTKERQVHYLGWGDGA